MYDLSSQDIKFFQKKILDWYTENKRDLPWRKSRDPYQILVSEIMLQQTQVSRVIPKYSAWLKRFPVVKALAKAPVSEVLAYWSGLGYNRRALYLKKMAQVIVEKFSGSFPENEELLKSLPGIGEYTARAILCFAFDKQIAVVDTNIRKVILTQFFYLNRDSGQTRMTDKEIQEMADQLLPKGKAYEWNQALMDYSSTVLREAKIPIPKQSNFLGSHRYYRGQILKILLQKKNIPIKDLGGFIKKGYTKKDEKWLHGLVLELKDEGFVEVNDNIVSIIAN